MLIIKKIVLILITILIFSNIIVFPVYSQEPKEPEQLEFSLFLKIREVNLNQAFVKIDITLQVRNFTKNASSLDLLMDTGFSQIHINCTGNRYLFQGELQNITWKIDGYGELFPYDSYSINFQFHPFLHYAFNQTVFVSDPWTYSINSNDTQIQFSGVNAPRLNDEWDLYYSVPTGDYLEVYLLHDTSNKSLLFIFPTVLILFLCFFGLVLTKNISIRATLYSATLLFTPMFIFAMQDFIPPRNSLSLAEFFSLILIIVSTLCMISSFRDSKESKISIFIVDFMVILGSFLLYLVLRESVFLNIPVFFKADEIRLWFNVVDWSFIIGLLGLTIKFFEQKIERLLGLSPRQKKKKADYIV